MVSAALRICSGGAAPPGCAQSCTTARRLIVCPSTVSDCGGGVSTQASTPGKVEGAVGAQWPSITTTVSSFVPGGAGVTLLELCKITVLSSRLLCPGCQKQTHVAAVYQRFLENTGTDVTDWPAPHSWAPCCVPQNHAQICRSAYRHVGAYTLLSQSVI